MFGDLFRQIDLTQAFDPDLLGFAGSIKAEVRAGTIARQKVGF